LVRYDEWQEIARRISAAWPAFGADPETERVYYQVLQDVDARAVERAVDESLREGRESPPPPGVLRDRALGIRTGAAAPPEPPRRRGTGWIVVAVLVALVLAVGAVAVTFLRDDGGDSEPATTTEVQTETATPTITVVPPPTETTPTVTEAIPTVSTQTGGATAP
jgi:hypothetical protein